MAASSTHLRVIRLRDVMLPELGRARVEVRVRRVRGVRGVARRLAVPLVLVALAAVVARGGAHEGGGGRRGRRRGGRGRARVGGVGAVRGLRRVRGGGRSRPHVPVGVRVVRRRLARSLLRNTHALEATSRAASRLQVIERSFSNSNLQSGRSRRVNNSLRD